MTSGELGRLFILIEGEGTEKFCPEKLLRPEFVYYVTRVVQR